MGKAELRIEIDEALPARAREAGVEMLALIEDALRVALPEAVAGVAAARARALADPAGAEARAKRWAEEKAEAIKACGERIEREVCFGEAWRNG